MTAVNRYSPISIAATEAVGNVVRPTYRHQPYPGDFEIETGSGMGIPLPPGR